MEQKILTDIGLSNNEAKVYLTLLETGHTTISNIAKKCDIHRSNVYDSIKKLIDKGLVSHVKRNDVSYYESCHPDFLLRLVQQKENTLRDILPSLALRKQMTSNTSEAHIFEGVTAFVNILYEFLKYNEQILVFGIPKEAPEKMKTKIPHFHTERINKGVSMLHIYNYDATDRIKELNEWNLTKAKSLPEKISSNVSTNICGDQVVLTLWTNPVISIQIKNQIIADSYKEYFWILWKHAK